MYNKIKNKIEEYSSIVIYHHVNPDLDCYGSQLALYDCLKKTYHDKNIYIAGEFNSNILKFYEVEYTLELPDFTKEDVLAIVVDTANSERIDGDTYKLCKEIIKIDHHIIVDSYGNINLEVTTASSCSEIVGDIFRTFHDEFVVTKQAAEALYLGIIGDSNRFMYNSTSSSTLVVAAYLLDLGVDFTKLFKVMYTRTKKDLDVQAFILNNYHYNEGVAYYILNKDNLDMLDLSREEGSNYVFALANVEEFKVWMAITQNVADNNYRVSMRSRDVVVNEIAAKFDGGGHMYASGAKLNNLDELESLVSMIKEKIHG